MQSKYWDMTLLEIYYAVKPDMESSVFAPAPSPKEIDFYLSTEFQRTADNGSSFGFRGRKCQLVDENGWVATIPAKTVVDIYVTRSGKEVAAYDGRLWYIAEVEKSSCALFAGPSENIRRTVT